MQVRQLDIGIYIDSLSGTLLKEPGHYLLAPFATLHSVRLVKFTNLLRVYAEYLEYCVTGTEPSNPFLKMFYALYSYAGRYEHVKVLINEACFV